MGMPWDVLVALTCERIARESGEEIVYGVDLQMTQELDGRVTYTALTERGDRALRIAQKIMERERGD